LVNIARIAAPDALLAHPLGTLAFTQNALPFDLELQKIGAARLTGPSRLKIETGYVGTPTATAPATPLQQHFAVGEYRDLSDAEKLSSPSFQPFTAGARFGSTSYACGAAAPDQDLEFETLYLEPEPESKFPFARIRFRERALHTADIAAISRQARQGAAALSGLRADERLKPRVNTAVSVGEARVAVAHADSLASAGIAFDAVTERAPALAADAIAATGLGDLRLVEDFELA
jgi:hypothetical protein